MSNKGDMRALAAAQHRVFIYCDSPAHTKRVAVTNFVLIGEGWHEVPASRAAATGSTGTGRTIVGDTLAAPGWANEPLPDGVVVRDRHELVCRKCKRRPVPVTVEKLHAVLDTLAAHGVAELSLSGLAAILNVTSDH